MPPLNKAAQQRRAAALIGSKAAAAAPGGGGGGAPAAAAAAALAAAAAAAAALAAQLAAADARRRLFISAFTATAQNGFGLDLDHALHPCRETWGEEDLFNAVTDLPHGAVKLKKPDGTPLWELDEDGGEVKDDKGARVQAIDPYGKKRTRLMYAAQAGDVARLRWLIARGRMELKDWEGRTALYWASRARHVEVARELLARGAVVDAAENHGATPPSVHRQQDWPLGGARRRTMCAQGGECDTPPPLKKKNKKFKPSRSRTATYARAQAATAVRVTWRE